MVHAEMVKQNKCDDGNLLDDDYCASDCRGIIGMCSDGIVQAVETCDDGNSESGDYCSSDCLVSQVFVEMVLSNSMKFVMMAILHQVIIVQAIV